jgi:hypothetical protein
MDPTQPLRDTIISGIKKIIPENSPLARSGEFVLTPEALARMEQEKIANDNAERNEAQNKTQAELAALGLKPSVAQPMPVSMPQTQVSDSDVVSRGGVAIPGEMQGKELTAQPVAPTNSYKQLIMSGVNAQDAASQKSLDATDQIMKQYEMNQARLQQSRFDAENELNKKISEIDQKQKDFTWDNRSLWEKSSTGQKVMIAITGFLSSLSPQGAKTFQDTVSNTMARDLAQQKERYNLLKEQKKDYQSLYGDLVKRFGDEDMASLQLTNMQLNAVSNRLKVLSEMSQSKIVAAKSLQGIDLVNSEIAKNQSAMLEKLTEIKNIGGGGYSSIKDDASRRKLVEQKDATNVATSAIDELITLGKSSRIPLSKASSQYEILVEKLSNEIAKANAGGKPSDVDVANAKKMVPSVYSPYFKDSMLSLKKRLNEDLKIKERNLGVTKPGDDIGRLE